MTTCRSSGYPRSCSTCRPPMRQRAGPVSCVPVSYRRHSQTTRAQERPTPFRPCIGICKALAMADKPAPRVDSDWDQRLSAAWASIDDRNEEEFVELIAELAAERGSEDAIGIFERAGSFDSTGRSDLAVPLYRQALDIGLTGERRRRAVI